MEQQLSNLQLSQNKITQESNAIFETIRSTATSMYEQYIGEKSEHKIEIKPALAQELHFKIKNLSNPPTELWFNDVQNEIYQKMKTQDEFLPGFKKSRSYLKLLEELDLVQQNIVDEDSISLSSLENLDICDDSVSKQKPNDCSLGADTEVKGMKHVRSLSDVTYLMTRTDPKKLENGKPEAPKEAQLKTENFSLSVVIIETGVVCEKGKTFGVYALRISVRYVGIFYQLLKIQFRFLKPPGTTQVTPRSGTFIAATATSTTSTPR